MSNEILSTSYDIQEKWITEVAPKYYDVDDLNMLRLGLFGYTNEIQANSLEDNINMMSLISNEIYLNKAILPNSIYAYAALGNFKDFNAHPSTIPFTLALRKSDLIKYSEQKPTHKEYSISRYSTLRIAELSFMVDYDIIIKLKPTNDNKDYILSAQYHFNYSNPMSVLTNPYIASKVLKMENEEYLFLDLTAKQVERTEYSYTIFTNDLVENIKFDIDYKGIISDFNVFYIPPKSNKKIQLAKYYIDSMKPEEDYFCFYQYNTATQFSIIFSAHPEYFKPEFNGRLLIELYTTEGSKGNFTYEGSNVEFEFYISDDTPAYIAQNVSKIIHFTYILGEAKDGTDPMDIHEIKYNAMKAFSVRKNIISDNDLAFHFKDITKNSKMLFIKKRDDIIKRIYAAFLLLKDKENNILPTNTINLVFKDNQYDNAGSNSETLMIKPGRIFHTNRILKKINSSGEILDEDIYYEPSLGLNIDTIIEQEDVDKYYFSNPYLIKVNKKPYFISYYLNSVFSNHDITYAYINGNNLNEFIMNRLVVERNAILSKDYKIKFSLYTSILAEKLYTLDHTGAFSTDTKNLDVRLYFKEGPTGNKYLGYAKCKMVYAGEERIGLQYEATLNTNDVINNNDEISIINSIYSIKTTTETLKEEVTLPADNLYVEIAVFYNGYDDKNKEYYKNLVPDTLNNFSLCNVFLTNSPVALFKDINNIKYSTVVVDTTTEPGTNLYKIKTVPVLKYSYLVDPDNFTELINILDYFRKHLQRALTVIENNFDIDTNFYNTYGPSKYFTIGEGDDKKSLATTAIKITLKIKLNVKLTELVKEDIEKFIINFVERVNTNEDVNYLYMSNLIKALENNFNYIRYIEFDHFNNEDSSFQIIENEFIGLDKLSNKQLIKYVPEYLNISRKTIKNDTGANVLSYVPEIYITYV